MFRDTYFEPKKDIFFFKLVWLNRWSQINSHYTASPVSKANPAAAGKPKDGSLSIERTK